MNLTSDTNRILNSFPSYENMLDESANLANGALVFNLPADITAPPASAIPHVKDISLEQYLALGDLVHSQVYKDKMTAMNDAVRNNAREQRPAGNTIWAMDSALSSVLREDSDNHYILTKFEASKEYSDYQKMLKLEHGKEHDIATIITIGNDKLTLSYEGYLTTPNSYAIFLAGTGNNRDILDNIYRALGEKNVSEESFAKGEGPTNAEFYQQTTGNSYYRYVMSEGRFG